MTPEELQDLQDDMFNWRSHFELIAHRDIDTEANEYVEVLDFWIAAIDKLKENE